MEIKSYNKLTIREILSSKARFISIMIIILLGVAFYSGIKSAGPDMDKAMNNLYNEYKLMDSKIVSNFGIDNDDIDAIKNDDRILDYYATHSIDVNLNSTSNVVKFMEYDNKSNINDYIVVDGRLPENSGEIAIDEEALKLNSDLAIGKEYIIDTDDETLGSFNKTKYEIVGIVRSPVYIEKGSRGITSIGKGAIDYFAVVNGKDISMEAYTELYVRFKNVQGINGYSDEYKELMKENNEYLEEVFSKRREKKIENFNEQMAESLAYGIEIPTDTEIPDINTLEYYIFDRTDNTGYLGYSDSINSLDKIASVLPVFFFLLAMMICLTTMTRMVEENRLEIGTLKALGYGDFQISKKYVIYALLSTVIGCGVGILIGSNILPMVISDAYESLYTLPKVEIYYYTEYIVQSAVVSILCTVGAAVFVVKAEVRNKPSSLMKVKAPKEGKKILLERITPLWKRLNFNYKVTFRNLFRYKQRMLMTVLGIAGSMAILVTGFGLKDSNVGMVERQFDKLWNYEAMVILNDDVNEEYNNTLNELPGYESSINLLQESVVFTKEGMNNQESTLYVVEDTEALNEFMILNNRKSGEEYEISDEGIIITEKLAKLLGVSSGDTITFKDDKNNNYEVKVDKIVENYVKHFIYMSSAYYEEIFGKTPVYNTQLLNFNRDIANEDEIATKLLENNNVVNVTLTSNMEKTMEESTANMNLVMVVIIISAGCLAFVVLYNLNNINVSERIRELSTIKVLGFYDEEVTMYILRENVILTLMGVVAGTVLGKLLHSFIIYTSETDTMMMYPDVSLLSYMLAALITVIFSVIVMIIMHIKLKKVNMIDALKSNE